MIMIIFFFIKKILIFILSLKIIKNLVKKFKNLKI